MPDLIVWEMTFPVATEEQQQVAKRHFLDLQSDPHVQSVQWSDDVDIPFVILLRVVFGLSHDRPAHHELHGLNIRYRHGEAHVGGSQNPPPVLRNGFRLGEWAQRKSTSCYYRLMGFRQQEGRRTHEGDLVELFHPETGSHLEVSFLCLYMSYEPIERPPRITTWHEKLLDEDLF